ncbi:transcriptional regulator [Hymenobacter aquaticus]|uniref:Transcriptional regulator n=1 Tax=Hymenobacter aquaticus TaxID=1867101 RepID=A0A4Z0Q689_9BACT|nr:RNA-binding domain-containing protein [Hymenobacter aquaticus]TGE25195.1 transcriptional regulator [Hymenobacter aquaticus]
MNLVKQIISGGESQSVVFLRNAADVQNIAQHVVALLNSGGGYIVIGVDENNQIAHLANSRDSAIQLRTQLDEVITPKAYFDVGTDDVDGQTVMMIDVPGGKDLPFVTNDRVYVRQGRHTIAASGNLIQSILQKRVAEVERWERRTSPMLDLDDLDHEEINLTVQSARELLRISIAGASTDKFVILSALGMHVRGQLTNAADVCFGQDPASRNPQIRVRAFSFLTTKGANYQDQATFSGPVSRILELAEAFVLRHTPVTAEFHEDRLQRTDQPLYARYVLREGLVNALAHRDYASFSGGITVEVYPDRVEIWNSGKLPKGWDARKLRTAHPSLPSNPDIAHILYLRGYMERIGRGTLKMIEVSQIEGLPSPKWQADEDGVRLTIFNRLYSKQERQPSLNERQQKLLDTLEVGQAITMADYTLGFASEVSKRQAQRDLGLLVDAGYLVLEGGARTSRYVRVE